MFGWKSLMFDLGNVKDAFASGGNRLCFIHPDDSNLCIKVLRADRSPSIKRSKKKFPFNYRSLKNFDDNWQEWLVYEKINSCVGEPAYKMIPRCFGLVDTNLGQGLVSEVIKDDDGLISISLKQYLWTKGFDLDLRKVLDNFEKKWIFYGMPSRNLLDHNLVVKMKNSTPSQLVVIDGLGWPDFLPLAYSFPSLAKRKAARKVARLRESIRKTIEEKIPNDDWGYHGWIEEKNRAAK